MDRSHRSVWREHQDPWFNITFTGSKLCSENDKSLDWKWVNGTLAKPVTMKHVNENGLKIKIHRKFKDGL